MASNTPLRRYKQNTHGGGIRDPLVMSWPKGIAARGELRHQFCHASDLAPTLLDVVGIKPPEAINGVRADADRGHELRHEPRTTPTAPSQATPQYFEMFGHRGLWQDGWKAVAFHPPGTPSTTTSGSCTISTRTSPRPTTSPTSDPSGCRR